MYSLVCTKDCTLHLDSLTRQRNHLNMERIKLFVVALMATMFLVSCGGGSKNDEWSKFRGNISNNGYSKNSAPKELSNLRWKFKTEDEVISSPAVADGTVFFGSEDTYLYAVDMKTGQEKWKFKTEDYIHSSPAVAYGTVFLGSADSYLYAVDMKTGQKKWRFKTETIIFSNPAVANGIVFFSGTFYLYAVDIKTGQEKWKFKTEDYIFSSPAVADGTVFFGSEDNNVYAVE